MDQQLYQSANELLQTKLEAIQIIVVIPIEDVNLKNLMPISRTTLVTKVRL